MANEEPLGTPQHPNSTPCSPLMCGAKSAAKAQKEPNNMPSGPPPQRAREMGREGGHPIIVTYNYNATPLWVLLINKHPGLLGPLNPAICLSQPHNHAGPATPPSLGNHPRHWPGSHQLHAERLPVVRSSRRCTDASDRSSGLTLKGGG